MVFFASFVKNNQKELLTIISNNSSCNNLAKKNVAKHILGKTSISAILRKYRELQVNFFLKVAISTKEREVL